ncbi:hypothetical protein IAI10_18685 [Clostridium sp. 19966]|uniref:hypothetical protein n=1 Tax=Clostridium sp. 19966 TaxID=2768166 RepID=UPI0028DFB694|nr:hypothetical protein [Clostridium sp. 19966]MDT8718687.1 hypothetical protein [Clostridium sp. 19966]
MLKNRIKFISLFLIFTFFIAINCTKSVSSTVYTDSKPLNSLSNNANTSNVKTVTLQAPSNFKHTGLLNSVEELRSIKAKIAEGKEPWKTAFNKMKSSNFAKINYTPTPYEIVSSDINGSSDHGANAEINDAIDAYTQALMWIFTDDQRYANNSARILDSWSSTLKSHQGQNWYLQASWAGSIFPLSAELLRATYPKWTNNEISQFSAMLNTAFLPILNNRLAYGNREFSVCNALVAIGVFNNDRAAFYQGINHWLNYLPCYFYASSDGSAPPKAHYWLNEPSNEQYYHMDVGLFSNRNSSWIYANNNPLKLGEDTSMLIKSNIRRNWYNPKKYANGICGETGRDLTHSEMAFASAINTAEIAWHQGIDLYSLDTKRLTSFMETNSSLRLGNTSTISALYSNGLTANGLVPTYEIAYNHYHNIKKISLPNTNKLITTTIRSMQNHLIPVQGNIFANRIWAQVYLNIDWETLTHADLN